ncbi:hypothetical protein B9072_005245 [Klebsiella pneumoniae]|nr:hypothetical protein B9072_005245 [Klebsiella pneumoniae]
MMSLWDALRMNMMISYQELVRTFLSGFCLVCHICNVVLLNRLQSLIFAGLITKGIRKGVLSG